MSIAHISPEGMRRLKEHGHPLRWEIASYGDDVSVTVECTRCGMVLVELVGAEEEEDSDEQED